MLSVQAVLLGFTGSEQRPVTVSQVPAVWQVFLAVHTTASLPVQVPLLQLSFRVQALPSSQGVPSGLTGVLQAPVVGLQVPVS